MKKNTTVQQILQEAIREKEIKELSKKYGYEEVGRKLTAYGLVQYFMGSSLLKIKSYRELAETSGTLGPIKVDYSELSNAYYFFLVRSFQRLSAAFFEKRCVHFYKIGQ